MLPGAICALEQFAQCLLNTMVKWINDMSIKGWFGAVAVSGAIFISLATPAESAERGPYIG